MEDEVDLCFWTQSDYEESLMNEHITEESLYQEDDQGGYNLRSKPSAKKHLIVAPRKKNNIPTKQPASLVKKIAAPAKKIVAPSI